MSAFASKKKSYFKFIYSLIFFIFLFFISIQEKSLADSKYDDVQIKKFINDIFSNIQSIVNKNSDNSNSQQTTSDIENYIKNKIDIPWMLNFVLSRYASKATDNQLDQLRIAYLDYLMRNNLSFINKINSSSLSINHTNYDSANDSYLVECIYQADEGQSSSVNVVFSVHKSDDGSLRFFNVTAEGIDLLISNRTQFRDILNSDGIRGLINYMKQG